MPIQIGHHPGTSLAPELPVAAPPPGGSAPGRLQGRSVERLPEAQTVTHAQTQALGAAAVRPSLQERQPVQHEPQFKLVRQARLSGLDSADAFTAKAGKPKDDISFSFLANTAAMKGTRRSSAACRGMRQWQHRWAPRT